MSDDDDDDDDGLFGEEDAVEAVDVSAPVVMEEGCRLTAEP